MKNAKHGCSKQRAERSLPLFETAEKRRLTLQKPGPVSSLVPLILMIMIALTTIVATTKHLPEIDNKLDAQDSV